MYEKLQSAERSHTTCVRPFTHVSISTPFVFSKSNIELIMRLKIKELIKYKEMFLLFYNPWKILDSSISIQGMNINLSMMSYI